jgi:peroxiredoxin
MSLIAPELSAVYEGFKKNAPDVIKAPIIAAKEDIVKSFDLTKAIKVGDKLPEFDLEDSVGKKQSSAKLLEKGPLIITFYRGEWCPFCNIAISGLQKHLDAFQAKHVTLVAITPERPDGTLTMIEKHDLKFSVLTDLHNEYAHKLGIVWKQPDSIRPVFDKFKHDLPRRNGDDSFAVPIPATLLVDKDGIVRNTYLEPDYTKRVEPQTILGWIEAL